MDLDLRAVDLKKINSLTKYPSIQTYHKLGPKKRLLPELTQPFTDLCISTEKIDGANGRIIFCSNGGYLVGSREELLLARTTTSYKPWDISEELGLKPTDPLQRAICSYLDVLAQKIHSRGTVFYGIVTYYFEIYGWSIGPNGKVYTQEEVYGSRLLDVSHAEDWHSRLQMSPEQLSGWRERGGQTYLEYEDLAEQAKEDGLELAPQLATHTPAELPVTLEDTLQFLEEVLPVTVSTLPTIEEEAGVANPKGAVPGKPEGVVLRSVKGHQLLKLRREDYERTLRIGNGK